MLKSAVDICFVALPFNPIERPMISFGLLQSILKKDKIKSVFIIGSGPIVIGQGCEFDYSGAQACKALKDAGYRVILLNSNPATIMTDPEMADSIYIDSINWQTIDKILKKEKPSRMGFSF